MRKSTLSEPRNAWTNPAETEVLLRLSPVDPMQQKSEPVYSLSAADQSGILAIARSSGGDGGDSTSTLVRPSFAQYTSWTTTRSGHRHHLPALLKQVAAGYCPLLISQRSS